MIFRVLLLVIFLLFSGSGHGQNYIFNRLTIGEGLLSNHVLCVWQDSTGYLWIGTQGGLQRFDGISMRTVLDERVDQILTDSAGTVWIRSGGRVATLNTSNFSVRYVAYQGDKEVYGPFKVWLRKDDAGRVFLVYVGKNCQYLGSDGRFSPRSGPFTLPDSLLVTDVVPDTRLDRYWVLSRNDFGFWDKKTRSYHSGSQSHDPMLASRKLPPVIQRLFIDRKSRYWMVATGPSRTRFFCFDRASGKFTTDTLGMNGGDASDLYEVYGFGNYEDSIVVAYGMNYFRGHHGKSFIDLRSPGSNPYGIHFNSIAGIFQDREGMLWVATDNGLYYTAGNKNQYTHILFSQEKRRASISSLLPDRQNRLWIGTWGRGTFVLSNEFSNPQIEPVAAFNNLGDPMQRVLALYEDRRGDVWAGCDQGRIALYHTGSKTATLYAPKAFENSSVTQIAGDKAGKLWIGLRNGDIWVHDPSLPFSDKNLKKAFALGGAVNRMLFLPDGLLWAAVTGKGLYIINAQHERLVHTIDLAKTGNSYIAGIRDIMPLNDSLVMVAGERLGTINTKTYTVRFDNAHTGRLAGTIFALGKDQNQHIWLGGASGIYKLNPSTKMLTKYSQQDGLLTIHSNSYVPERSATLKNGRLAFGGNQHLVIFDPNEYKTSPRPPDVTITGFQLNNRYLSLDSLLRPGAITLPYTHNSFRIDFAAISFAQRERTTYEYKMDGLDADWMILPSGGHVSYNFLPDGRYTFSVRAKNEQGEYSPKTTTLELRIKPPFWKTIWFYLLVASLTACVLFFLHRLRVEKLLHIEKVRNRLARDLHDDMGSTLSTINILSSMALDQKSLDEAKSKQYLTTISQSTHQMMEAMDDIVWSINPVNDSMARILARMKETAGAVLEPQQIDYRFETEPSVAELHLSMESRREIFLIFKEALNNIVKYAGCSLVTVGLSRKAAQLMLTIADNGVGFDMPQPGSTVRGNGLKNMQIRAGNVNGTLTVVSKPGDGTTITLWMPIA
ncbi:Two component regulator propeller [Dyadobacter soli]|uniref:Two component regulator propeller n=1 Tax=Dyadobacter soli TaxID=659014 RepID=A0A1G7Y2Q1_9BACT|nr:sensor histidine kinase [Dyadobacter soli]SDG90240.1 Two component regulator propeller [Dyadobacter soli]